MKTMINGYLFNLKDLRLVVSKKIGTKWFSLEEANVYRTPEGALIKITMLGGVAHWNYVLDLRIVNVEDVRKLLHGEEIDEATEKVLREEHILD